MSSAILTVFPSSCEVPLGYAPTIPRAPAQGPGCCAAHFGDLRGIAPGALVGLAAFGIRDRQRDLR